jgi:hypothetical protein
MQGLPRRPRFDPRSAHLGSAVDKVRWHWDEFFVGYFCPPLSFHECSILIFHLPQTVCDRSKNTFREANSSSASQAIALILCNPKVH